MTQPQPASASARFLDESVLPVFTDLRMTAFGRTVIDIAADPVFDSWSFSDKVLHALDKEVAAKRERRVNKLLKASRSPNLDACIEDITYAPGRNLNKEQITRLAHCCRFGVVGTASLRSWYRCSTYPVLCVTTFCALKVMTLFTPNVMTLCTVS